VVGAGAAGLTAALRSAEAGARVTLLNAHPKIGLKILMSGGTRCNVTHREVNEFDFNGGSHVFVRKVLPAFTADQARAWLESLGIGLKLEETGKYFPVSDDAQTVLDALLDAVRGADAEIVSGARVVRIERRSQGATETGGRFHLGIERVASSAALGGEASRFGQLEWPLPAREPGEWMEADAVILACGGLSFPRTGSDGTGYALATALGHTIEPPIPALTPLTAEDPLCRSVQGLAVDAELALWLGGKRERVVPGSLLFTHFGYSGPAALDFSRHWLRAEAAGERRATASFLPGERIEQVLEAWRIAATESKLTVRRYLGRRLPDRLVVELTREAAIESSTLVSQVDRVRRAALLARLTERPLPITGTLGYEKAEVTAGGVGLSEVSPATMESRIVPGLYLCGEMLDVEGRLGGFNFQWAWSSGTVAGRAAASR